MVKVFCIDASGGQSKCELYSEVEISDRSFTFSRFNRAKMR